MINTFQDLQEVLELKVISTQLMDCVEFANDMHGNRLKLKDNYLEDSPPDDFDIDQEIFNIQQWELDREFNEPHEEDSKKRKRKKVVIEGDSWCNLPPIIRPKAIGDRLKSNGNYKVRNIARWGHTLNDILKSEEYLDKIGNYKADYFLFGASGNDLQNGLENEDDSIIKEFSPEIDDDDFLTSKGENLIDTQIRNQYEKLLDGVIEKYPSLPILCHAYDYTRPLNTGGKGGGSHGKYIGQYLHRKNIPRLRMSPIMDSIIDRLNQVISDVISARSTVIYVDCRRVTQDEPWRDDMHPNTQGFIQLTEKIEYVLDGLRLQ